MDTDFEKHLLLPKRTTHEKPGFSKTVKVFGKLAELRDDRFGTRVVGTWSCDPRYLNQLCLTDADHPLIAIEVHFVYAQIRWRAGNPGWPWYYTPDPLQYKVDNDYRPALNHHRVLWDFGGTTWSTETMSGGGRGWQATEVFV